MVALESLFSYYFYYSFRKDSEDWGWGGDNEWSDAKSSSNIEQKTSKKSSNSTLGGLAKKKSEKAKTNEDLLIGKRPFNNFVNRSLTFFDHPPTPSKQSQ